MAQQPGLSTSRGPRLTQALERRHGHPESGWWDPEDGRPGFTRLGVATRSPFGRTRGGGLEPMRECFTRLPLEGQGGCAPSALRSVMPALAAALLAPAAAGEKDACTGDEGRASLGAGEATCLERRMLVCLARPTG